MRGRTWWWLVAAAASVAAAWAAPAKKPARQRCQMWVDLASGEPVAYEDILGDLAGVRVTYLGERHGVPRHQEWEARIVADLARRKVPLVLAMEQLEAFQQPAVERYNRGEITFAELAKQVDWAHRWSGYEAYRPAVEAAHKAGVPILALNARAQTVHAVFRAGGVAKLDAKTRAELPAEMELNDRQYERLLDLELQVHMAATPESLRPMVEAQIVRDETMAQRLSDYLSSDAGKGRHAVVLTGQGHVAYGLGMPARVRRRLPGVKERIVLFSESGDVKLTPEMQAESKETHITHEDLRSLGRPIGDYLQVAEAASR